MSETVVLKEGMPCADYPDVMQMSVACQNCRFNQFDEGSIYHQKCLPHSQEEAIKKGKPQVAAANHFEQWMRENERRKAERKAKEELVEEA